jgi:hypothetical protein
VDPYLRGVEYQHAVRAITGFAGAARTGYFGNGRKVQGGTVSGAITAIAKNITLVQKEDPTKLAGRDSFLPRIAQMLDGFKKDDPPTVKKMPCTIDLPEKMASWGLARGATELEKAVGDLGLIAMYYLLRVGEYTVKKHKNETKQTEQFKMKDVTFFKVDKRKRLRRLNKSAKDELIMTADGFTLKIGNQKNGWKNVSIYHEANGDPHLCPGRALGRRYCYIRKHGNERTYLSAYWIDGQRCDVADHDMRLAIKAAGRALEYPTEYGIDIDRLDTHSLRSGGANQLAEAGYSEMQIQKMGRWRGDTFKEYIREELACFSAGMSKAMKKTFKFVNITGSAQGAMVDVTSTVVAAPRIAPASAAA